MVFIQHTTEAQGIPPAEEFSYVFRSLFRQVLDNLSRLPADHAGKALISVGFLPPKCVDKRGLFRCPQTFHDSSFVEEAQDNDRDHRSQK